MATAPDARYVAPQQQLRLDHLRDMKPAIDSERLMGESCVVAGVDEVGRGPLAGPVLAAAVVLDPRRPVPGIADSKRLSAARREPLAELIRLRARAWCVAEASVSEIDEINILQASLLAMRRAVTGLHSRPELVLVDGNQCPDVGVPVRAVVGGDGTIAAIGAASIIAKVARDAIMAAMEHDYPGYGFARNKGYPTPEHLRALHTLGPTLVHRHSFAPVRAAFIEGRGVGRPR